MAQVQPLRAQAPFVLALAGAIILAHLARSFGPLAWSDALFARFAVIPARFGAGPEAFGSIFDWTGPLFGHVFLHGGFLHLTFNCLLLIQASSPLARPLGLVRYAIVLFGAAAGGAALYIVFNPASIVPAIGASGAVSGLIAGYLMAEHGGPAAALRAPAFWTGVFWFNLVNVGLAALARISGAFPIAWEAHLGGFLAGFALCLLFAPALSSRLRDQA